jgi:hypothetical protein
MLPVRPLEGRLRDDTLPGCRRLQMTPAHRQKPTFVLFHETSEPEWSDSPSLNASSAFRSPEESPRNRREEDDSRRARRRSNGGRKYMVAVIYGVWCAT